MSTPIDGWYAAARGVHLAACLLLLGVWIFDRWIVGCSSVAPAARRIGRWLLAICFPVAFLSGVAWFYFAADGMKDPDQPLSRAILWLVWTSTQFGRVWQLRTILWAALGVVYFLPSAGITGAAKRSPLGRIGDWLGCAIAAAFVASLAWAGHGATGPAPFWHRAADVVHLLVCAAWPIGLIPLGLLLWQIARHRLPISAVDAAGMIRRFSAMSLAAVATLIGTGTINGWCLVGSFPALWNTQYGRVLLIKEAVFLTAILLGASNFFFGKPRLIRLSAARAESLPILRQMMWVVAVESILGLGLVAIVGVLGLLMPARM